ncbi:MAG: GNAT family protein [bacterium]|nr:GNAT family protein [bacterium]
MSNLIASPLFQGRLVRLTAMRPEDVHTVVRWYENSDFSRHFDAMPAYPRGEDRARSLVLERHGGESYAFAMRPLYTDELIGIIDLDGIQWNNRVAWLGIGIGEPANRGRGYGRDAMALVLRFAFRELNLHRIQLTVFSYNVAAVNLYESLGFRHEGTFREAIHREGERFDMLLYGLLAHEWKPAE